MKQELIERKFILSLLTSINLIYPFKDKINHTDILGIYQYGSELYNTSDNKSDLDYCVIISDNVERNIFVRYNGYIQYETIDIDIHILTETRYKELVSQCNDMALSLYFQPYPILKYEYKTKLDLFELRKSISTKANNSYVKAKKKLIVEKPTDANFRLAYKSMFHSLRLLDLGIVIANIIINKEKHIIYDFTSMGENIGYIKEVFSDNKNNWNNINKIFKPIFNEYASNFKKLAPKIKKS